MKHNRTSVNLVFVSLSVLVILACNFLTGGTTPASAPTQPPEPTKKSAPTSPPAPTQKPLPTVVPVEATATEAPSDPSIEEFNTLLQEFADKGYVTTTDGDITPLADFKQEWAQLGWFNWWTFDPNVTTGKEFIFKGHFSWSSATSSPDPSGCGIIFGLQDSGDFYAVFLDNKRIYFYMYRSQLYAVGKTSGKGTTNFSNPAESDFALAVSNGKAYASVDGAVTTYTLSVDQTSAGTFAVSLMSGTNRDYGTRCEATKMVVWSAK
jgi:hypothetical protein